MTEERKVVFLYVCGAGLQTDVPLLLTDSEIVFLRNVARLTDEIRRKTGLPNSPFLGLAVED